MIRTKRRTKIIIEKHRVVTITDKRKGHALGHCQACDGQVQMVTAETAAILSGVSQRAIYRRVETGEIHYTETPAGLLLICANSVKAK